jgi:REP element-mobilizing transposase RayT
MHSSDAHPKRLRRLTTVWIRQHAPTYFVTICTHDRQPVLANDRVHERFRNFIFDSNERYGWWVSCYVLMPDHLHLFAADSGQRVRLGAWVKALKAVVGHKEFKWQAGFFDHVLRSDESYAQKWEYIRNNPVRKGLVANPDDWPFAAYFHPRDGRPL